MRTHTRRLPISIIVFLLLYGLTALSACGATPAAQAPTAAPAGDPAKGELVFNTSDCKACHVTTDQKLVGPGLKGVMEGKGQYGDKLPNGKPISDKNATEWIKVGVHRARPALYRSGAVEAAAVHENRESFPSGHASVAFAAATTYATLAARQHLPHATRNSILLYAGAVSVSVLRVAGGKHFPTDVIGGAALGTGIGWAVARLHPMTR